MASVLKNPAATPQVLPRARPVNLGTIVSAGDAVGFTVSEPSRDHQGYLVIEVVGGTTPTIVLEASIDGGVTFFVFPSAATTGIFFPYAITGQIGGDTAATFAGQYNISGHAGGTQFRLGRTDANGGNAQVFALAG